MGLQPSTSSMSGLEPKVRGKGRDSGGFEPSQLSVPGTDLLLDQSEITVHLMPEAGLRQAAIGVDGVNLRHF